MRKKTKKLLAATLSTIFSISLLIPHATIVNAAETEKETVKADVYPRPVTSDFLSGEGMRFDGTVNLIVHGTHEEATVEHMKQLLKENGISYNMTDEVRENEANILLSSDESHCDACGECEKWNSTALGVAGGYVLHASDDENTHGEVLLVGADEDGAFNAVMTFKQMLEQGTEDRFAEVNISDYPNIKQRGVIEGFYGFPWSFEDRANMIKDMSNFKMNIFIYAPKDDPYHRDEWRELYPEKEAEEIRELVEISKRENVDFVWMVHPGATYEYGSSDDYTNSVDFDRLIDKFEQLYSLGVRQFGISYDDINYGDDDDFEYHTELGAKHAAILEKVKEEWISQKPDVKPLVTVGSRYCNKWGPGIEQYMTQIMEVVDEDDIVLWTGNDTMSTIDKEYFDIPKQITGIDKNLSAWWNHPVNDYWDDRLFMQEFGDNVDRNIDNLNAFVLNPMNQAEASKVSIYCGADYAWNSKGFESTNSWERAIRELTPESSDAFERFADNIGGVKLSGNYDESTYMSSVIQELNTQLDSGSVSNETATAMLQEFELILKDVEQLENMSNKDLLDDCITHINSYKVLANAGISGMKAVLAFNEEKYVDCFMSLVDLRNRLDEKATYTVKSLEAPDSNHSEMWEKDNVASVGNSKLVPLLEKLQNVFEPATMSKFKNQSLEFTTNIEDLTGEIEYGEKIFTTTPIDTVLNQNQWIGMKLPEAKRLDQINVTGVGSKGLILQYSFNGLEWIDAETAFEENTYSFQKIVDATYIRIINKDSEPITLASTVLSAKLYSDTRITNPNAATTMNFDSTADKISNVVDGDFKTCVSFENSDAGSYIEIDLGKAVPIHDIKIYNQQYWNFPKLDLEVSTDGKEWTKVGDTVIVQRQMKEDYTIDFGAISLNLYSTTLDAEGTVGRYIRLISPDAFTGWSYRIIYEIEVNKTVDHSGELTEWASIIDTKVNTENETKSYDLDLNTYLTAETVENGDTLIYKTSKITKIDQLIIAQAYDHVSNAKVEVMDVKGNWIELGYLSEESNLFDLNKVILGVRLTFDGKVAPMISEIMVTEGTTDSSKLSALIAEIGKMDLSKYTEESVAVLHTALEVAESVLNNVDATQEQIDEAMVNLTSARENLEVKPETGKTDNPIKPDEPGNTDKPNDKDQVGTPNTGDAADTSVLLLLLTVSVAGIVVLVGKKKRVADV